MTDPFVFNLDKQDYLEITKEEHQFIHNKWFKTELTLVLSLPDDVEWIYSIDYFEADSEYHERTPTFIISEDRYFINARTFESFMDFSTVEDWREYRKPRLELEQEIANYRKKRMAELGLNDE